MTNQEVWEKACERVGITTIVSKDYIYPRIDDPACIVAMFKAYIPYCTTDEWKELLWALEGRHGDGVKFLALAVAVNAMPLTDSERASLATKAAPLTV